MSDFLKTPRLLFKQFQSSDHQLIKNLDSDPEVVKYISNGLPSDDNEVNRAIGVFLEHQKKFSGRLGFWKAILKDSNEFIGWFHLRPRHSYPEDLSNLEIGYRLKKKFWGLGYATEGSQSLIDYARSEFNNPTIWAHAMLANKSSINVMKKVGLDYVSEGIYEQWPGEDKRCVWYKS